MSWAAFASAAALAYAAILASKSSYDSIMLNFLIFESNSDTFWFYLKYYMNKVNESYYIVVLQKTEVFSQYFLQIHHMIEIYLKI